MVEGQVADYIYKMRKMASFSDHYNTKIVCHKTPGGYIAKLLQMHFVI